MKSWPKEHLTARRAASKFRTVVESVANDSGVRTAKRCGPILSSIPVAPVATVACSPGRSSNGQQPALLPTATLAPVGRSSLDCVWRVATRSSLGTLGSGRAERNAPTSGRPRSLAASCTCGWATTGVLNDSQRSRLTRTDAPPLASISSARLGVTFDGLDVPRTMGQMFHRQHVDRLVGSGDRTDRRNHASAHPPEQGRTSFERSRPPGFL